MNILKKVPTTQQSDGKICYGSGILTNIIKLSVEEVQGVLIAPSTKPIDYFFDKDGVVVDIDVKINFTCNVSETAYNVQESVRHNVEAMTEYKISTVNVNVVDVFFDESLAERK
jgi:uncharacterized alkaline shock family protein YloU